MRTKNCSQKTIIKRINNAERKLEDLVRTIPLDRRKPKQFQKHMDRIYAQRDKIYALKKALDIMSDTLKQIHGII